MGKTVTTLVLLVVLGLAINQQLTPVNGGVIKKTANAIIGAGDALSTLKSMPDCPPIVCLIKRCAIEPKEEDNTGCGGACLIKELKIGKGPKKDAYSKKLFEMKNKACGYVKLESELHTCILKHAHDGMNTCKQFDTVIGECVQFTNWETPKGEPCPT